MSYEIKELSGSLFEKTDKTGQQPDFTGNVKIEGKEWRLAGWWTTSRGGTEYLSLKVTDPEEYRRSQQQSSSRPAGRSSGSPPPQRGRHMTDEEFERERAKRRAEIRPNAAADITDDDIPF